jgi:hypothetical protein
VTFPTPAPSVPVIVGPVIRTQHIGAELAIDLGEFVLVASVTAPDAWHEVREQRCTCKGFGYRGHCRHLAVAVQAQMAGVETATPVETEVKGFATPRVSAYHIPFDDDDDYYSADRIAARRARAEGGQ